MYESRTIVLKKKPRIILDKTFGEFKDYQAGESGQCVIEGVITADRIEQSQEGTDFLVKTLEIGKIEVIQKKDSRTGS